jgi:uncharacterized protein (DUF488 family)
MIYTSFFDNVGNIVKSIPNARFISIAGKTPESFIGVKYKPLMPHYSWWKEWHDKFIEDLESSESTAWYVEKYNKTVLSSLDPLTTARELKELASWQPTFIMCYEPVEKFCHRHIVAEWLTKCRIECMEWSYEDKS